jgi:hypothetical protein
MNEKGSDERLYEIAAPHEVTAPVEHEQACLDAEEDRVASKDPAKREPGRQHPDPDETPDEPYPEHEEEPDEHTA